MSTACTGHGASNGEPRGGRGLRTSVPDTERCAGPYAPAPSFLHSCVCFLGGRENPQHPTPRGPASAGVVHYRQAALHACRRAPRACPAGRAVLHVRSPAGCRLPPTHKPSAKKPRTQPAKSGPLVPRAHASHPRGVDAVDRAQHVVGSQPTTAPPARCWSRRAPRAVRAVCVGHTLTRPLSCVMIRSSSMSSAAGSTAPLDGPAMVRACPRGASTSTTSSSPLDGPPMVRCRFWARRELGSSSGSLSLVRSTHGVGGGLYEAMPGHARAIRTWAAARRGEPPALEGGAGT